MPAPVGRGVPPTPIFDFARLQKIASLVSGHAFAMSESRSREDASPAQGSEPRDVIVMRPEGLFKASPEGAAEVRGELARQGVAVGDALAPICGVTARVSEGQVAELEKAGYAVFDDAPLSLVPGFPSRVVATPAAGDDDVSMPKVDPVALTHSDAVQRQGVTGKGQVVAVIDSGFQHPSTPLVAWKDFVDGSSTPVDPVGHGTHVAGDVRQIAPEAGLVGIRVMNAQGQGRPSDIIRGLQWAIENKERYNISVINMSLGGEPTGTPSSQNPIDRAVVAAIRKGITVVSAAGNSGPESHTIGSPADEPLGIAVGSGRDSKTVSDFSSRGPTDDGLSKPDVVAPGEFIVSWNVPGSQLDKTATVIEGIRHMTDDQLVKLLRAKPQLIEALGLPADVLSLPPDERLRTVHQVLPPIYKPDADHLAGPGTSFAAPLVAGIVADLRSASPSLTPQKVKDVLTATADPMDARFGRNDQGAGFVNAEKALAAAKA